MIRGPMKILPLVLLLAVTLAPSAQAQTRVDLYDRKSNRTGSATIDERTGRIDTYDTRSNRTGYGYIAPSGSVGLYDLKGQRTGSDTLSQSRRSPCATCSGARDTDCATRLRSLDC